MRLKNLSFQSRFCPRKHRRVRWQLQNDPRQSTGWHVPLLDLCPDSVARAARDSTPWDASPRIILQHPPRQGVPGIQLKFETWSMVRRREVGGGGHLAEGQRSKRSRRLLTARPLERRLRRYERKAALGSLAGVTGVLGVDERPRFRSYVVEQRRPSYEYREDLRVGAVLPEEGVTYYDVPPEYGVREHRYTVVNGRTVLVEPRTRRVIEIVE